MHIHMAVYVLRWRYGGGAASQPRGGPLVIEKKAVRESADSGGHFCQMRGSFLFLQFCSSYYLCSMRSPRKTYLNRNGEQMKKQKSLLEMFKVL